MALSEIFDGAYRVPMGSANAYLLDAGPELVLVDAGFPGKASAVFDAVRALGRSPRDLRHLVFTHGHPDHIGSAAAIVRDTGATTWMHAADAPLAESGGPFRPMVPGRGPFSWIGYRLFWRPDERTEPFRVDRHIADGDTLPLAGGLQAVALPGHCAGQVGFLWRGGRLMIAGDACANVLGLSDPVGFEDPAEGRRSQRRLAGLGFEAGCFGHGKPILAGGAEKLRRAFG